MDVKVCTVVSGHRQLHISCTNHSSYSSRDSHRQLSGQGAKGSGARTSQQDGMSQGKAKNTSLISISPSAPAPRAFCGLPSLLSQPSLLDGTSLPCVRNGHLTSFSQIWAHPVGYPPTPCLWALQPPGSTGHEKWLAHLPVPQRPVGSKPSVKLVLNRADELSPRQLHL